MIRGVGLTRDKILKVTASPSCGYCAQLTCAQRLGNETRVWDTVKHPNILEFLGVVLNMGEFSALVSPYCAKGNITSYLQEYPESNRLHLVARVPQFTPSRTNFWLDR